MWYSCSVALNCWFKNDPINKAVPLSCGIILEPIPEWVKEDEALKYLSWNDKKNIKDSELVFSTRYKADALGSHDPDWKGKNPRGIQSVVDEKFTLASVALWLIQPTNLSCGPTFHFNQENDSSSMRSSGNLKSISIDQDELDNTLTLDHIIEAGEILERILLLQRDGNIWYATRLLVLALTEKTWEIRYLLLWVILEMLFGSENQQEITYRLSLRVAFFIEHDSEKCIEKFKQAKDAYRIRSKTVHGLRLSKLTSEASVIYMKNTEEIIRQTFIKILSSAELTNTFTTKKREEYLENLIFS